VKLLTLAGLSHKLRQARDTAAGAVVPDLTAASLHRLAALLERVTSGDDAREVFAQPKRGRGQPAKQSRDTRAVLDYWRHRVANPADAAGAAELVARRYEIERSTLKRLTRKHRDEALWALEAPFARWEGERLVRGNRGLDTSALRAYLAKKSKGGNRPK
jgi:hypothetical protein